MKRPFMHNHKGSTLTDFGMLAAVLFVIAYCSSVFVSSKINFYTLVYTKDSYRVVHSNAQGVINIEEKIRQFVDKLI